VWDMGSAMALITSECSQKKGAGLLLVSKNRGQGK
jgi:hypothetical protein